MVSGEEGPKTLFATHYHELTRLSQTLPRLQNFSVAVKEWNDEIIFMRQVTPGASERSFGIQVARLAGLPDEVVGRAKEILAGLEKGEGENSGKKTEAGEAGPVVSPEAETKAELEEEKKARTHRSVSPGKNQIHRNSSCSDGLSRDLLRREGESVLAQERFPAWFARFLEELAFRLQMPERGKSLLRSRFAQSWQILSFRRFNDQGHGS